MPSSFGLYYILWKASGLFSSSCSRFFFLYCCIVCVVSVCIWVQGIGIPFFYVNGTKHALPLSFLLYYNVNLADGYDDGEA